MGNDGNPVPQDVCFIHVVSGENNGAACQAQTQGHGTNEACQFSLTTAASAKEMLAKVSTEERPRSFCGHDLLGWQSCEYSYHILIKIITGTLFGN